MSHPIRMALAGAVAALAISACGGSETGDRLPFEDGAESEDVVSIWGEYACASEDRIELVEEDGETHRKLTVIDGDDADGERCELGRNDHTDGPTAVYTEGERRITRFSIRLPDDFPLESENFQVVMQMKQSQPSANGGGTPVLSLEAREGHWILFQSTSSGPSSDTRELWSAPAETGVWANFEFDVLYSRDPEKGSVRVGADLDDGELEEDSGEIAAFTLKTETDGGGEDGIEPGESIPSHLRLGLYHDPKVPCPPPDGCSVEFGDVEVVAAG